MSSGYRTSDRFREKLAERLNPTKKSKMTKKRKTGFLIFAGNITLLVIIFIIAQSVREPEGLYKTVSFASEQCNFRYSIMAETNSDNYIITLTIEPIVEALLTFNETIATLNFIYNDINVLTIPMGDNITQLELQPSDVRTFTTSANKRRLYTHILERGNYQPKKREHLFDFEGTSVIADAQLTINTPKKISQTIQFRTGNLK